MSSDEAQRSIGYFNIFMGAVLVVASILVMIYPDPTLITLLIIISISVLLIGASRLINGATNKTFENKIRAWKVLTGFLAIVVGILTMIMIVADPAVSVKLVIFIFAALLIAIGVSRFATGLMASEFPKWFRAIVVIVGILSIVLSIVIFIFPDVGEATLIFLLAFVLMFNGLARVALGLVKTE